MAADTPFPGRGAFCNMHVVRCISPKSTNSLPDVVRAYRDEAREQTKRPISIQLVLVRHKEDVCIEDGVLSSDLNRRRVVLQTTSCQNSRFKSRYFPYFRAPKSAGAAIMLSKHPSIM